MTDPVAEHCEAPVHQVGAHDGAGEADQERGDEGALHEGGGEKRNESFDDGAHCAPFKMSSTRAGPVGERGGVRLRLRAVHDRRGRGVRRRS